MNNIIPFDTLALAQALRDEAGYDQKQAEGTAKVFARLLVADLTTKGDLSEAKTALKTDIGDIRTDIARVKADLEIRLAETKADLLKWVVGAIGFQTVVIIGTLVTLLKAAGH